MVWKALSLVCESSPCSYSDFLEHFILIQRLAANRTKYSRTLRPESPTSDHWHLPQTRYRKSHVHAPYGYVADGQSKTDVTIYGLNYISVTSINAFLFLAQSMQVFGGSTRTSSATSFMCACNPEVFTEATNVNSFSIVGAGMFLIILIVA